MSLPATTVVLQMLDRTLRFLDLLQDELVDDVTAAARGLDFLFPEQGLRPLGYCSSLQISLNAPTAALTVSFKLIISTHS